MHLTRKDWRKRHLSCPWGRDCRVCGPNQNREKTRQQLFDHAMAMVEEHFGRALKRLN